MRWRRSSVRASSLSVDRAARRRARSRRRRGCRARRAGAAASTCRSPTAHDRDEPAAPRPRATGRRARAGAAALLVLLHHVPGRDDHPAILPNHRCPPCCPRRCDATGRRRPRETARAASTGLRADGAGGLDLGGGRPRPAGPRQRRRPACRPPCGPPAVHGLRVGVLTKAELQQAATRWAQGGVAAVLGGDDDSTDLHLADTLAAGAGLCDVDAVRVLVDEGPARVHELIALGAVFDRDPEGDLALAREGGHSMPRIVHAGGAATGCRDRAGARRRRARRRRRPCSRAGSPSTCSSRAAGAAASSPLDPTARAHEVRATHVLAGHRRRRPALRGDHQPRARPPATASPWRCGPAWPSPTSSSCSSTRPRCTTRRCPGRCCPRRCAGHGALLRDTRRRAVRRRAAAARRGEPGHDRPHARAGRRPPLARRHRPRALRRAVPDHRRRRSPRSASTRPRTGCRSPPPPTTCSRRRRHRPRRRHRRCPGLWAARRGRLHRRARRQPAGLQLAARGHGVRARGSSRPSTRGKDGPDATGAMRAVLGGGAASPAGRRGRPCPRRRASGAGRRAASDAAAGDDRAAPACCARPASLEPTRRGACAGPAERRRPRSWPSSRNLATVGRALVRAALRPRRRAGAPLARRPPRDLRVRFTGVVRLVHDRAVSADEPAIRRSRRGPRRRGAGAGRGPRRRSATSPRRCCPPDADGGRRLRAPARRACSPAPRAPTETFAQLDPAVDGRVGGRRRRRGRGRRP